MNAFYYLVQVRCGNQWQTLDKFVNPIKAKQHAQKVSTAMPLHAVRVKLA